MKKNHLKLENFDVFSDNCDYASDIWECKLRDYKECDVEYCPRCKPITLCEYMDRGGGMFDYPDLFGMGYDTVEVIECS